MKNNRKPEPRLLADMHLGPVATTQLDALAMHYGRSLDQAAIVAVHIAYLAMLDEKRQDALHALNVRLGHSNSDDEMPF